MYGDGCGGGAEGWRVLRGVIEANGALGGVFSISRRCACSRPIRSGLHSTVGRRLMGIPFGRPMLKLGARALLSLKLRRSVRVTSSKRQGSLPMEPHP